MPSDFDDSEYIVFGTRNGETRDQANARIAAGVAYLDEESLAKHKAEVSEAKESIDRADRSMKIYFVFCALYFAIDVFAPTALRALLDHYASNYMNASWNTVDGSFGVASAVRQLAVAKYSAHDAVYKQRFAKAEIVMGAALTVSSITVAVAQSAALIGVHSAKGTVLAKAGFGLIAALPAVAAVASIAFAGTMWVAAARSYQATHRARQKMSRHFLLKDRILKLKTIREKLKGDPGSIIWIKKQEKIVDDIVALGQVLYAEDRDNPEALYVILRELNEIPDFKEIDAFKQCGTILESKKVHTFAESLPIITPLPDILKKTPNAVSIRRINTLVAKRRARFKNNLARSIEWSLAGIGMTLLAVGLFVNPVTAVPLLVAGTIVTVAAGAAKAGHTIYMHHQTRQAVASVTPTSLSSSGPTKEDSPVSPRSSTTAGSHIDGSEMGADNGDDHLPLDRERSQSAPGLFQAASTMTLREGSWMGFAAADRDQPTQYGRSNVSS